MSKFSKTKFVLILLTALFLANNAFGRVKITNANKMEIWRQATFGMFIHWGVYSYLGGIWHGQAVKGYSEHIFRSMKIPLKVYREEVIKKFNPVDFNAEEWLDILQQAGMRYMVITAKHHDGFAMWDSKVTDYDIVDMTPFKRDPMRELRDACKKRGILFGFYYSHAQDWSHPWGQRNQWDFGHPQPNKRRWWEDKKWAAYLDKAWIYVRQKSIPQLRELILNYDPDILWFDTQAWLPPQMTREIVLEARRLKPELIINSRGTPGIYDYKSTNDRPIDFPPTDEKYWEAIPTTNESYGYHAMDHSHKPPSFFIRLLAKAAARGGNLLMNVGPMGNGKIDPRDVAILKGIGDWLKVNGQAIYGVQRTPLPVQAWGQTTVRGNILYLHIFQWPKDGQLVLGGLKSKVQKVWLLADARQNGLPFVRINELDWRISLPPSAPDTVNTVVAVQCSDAVRADSVRLLATNVAVNELHVFDGKLHGKGIKYGSGNHKSNFILHWSNPQSYVSWSVRLNEAARFRVEMINSADERSAGNKFLLQIADHEIEGVVQKGKYRRFYLGEVALKAGRFTIAVRPLFIRQGNLMHLTKLRLIPLPAGREKVQ